MTKLNGAITGKTKVYGRPTRSVIPSVTKLNTALNDVEDLLQRALTPFILLGQVAKDVNEQKSLTGKKVVVGVLKKYLTKEAKSTLLTYMDFEPHSWGYSYMSGDVEIQIRIIKQNYAVLQHPEAKWHMASDYYVPNPFETYWKMKGLIR